MIGRTPRFVPAAVVAAVCFAAGLASAQSSEKDADAERLFREAQKLMEQKRFGEACPKFEAAYQKDQQLGSLLNLAYCHKQQGAIWPAWLEFKEAEVKAAALKRTDRRDFARQRMAELEKSLAKAVIDAPARGELGEVRVDDRRVFDAERGAPFAIEPGERKVTFLAKGKKPAVQLVSVAAPRKGEGTLHITAPELEDEPPPPPPVVETKAAPAAPPPRPARVEPDPSAGGWRTAMWLGLGVGVPVLAAGAVLGVITLGSGCITAKRNTASCPTPADRADASTLASLSTVGVVAGGALTAAGLGILLFAPKPARPKGREAAVTPELGLGWAGVRGTF